MRFSRLRSGLAALYVVGCLSAARQPAPAAPLNACRVGQQADFASIMGDEPHGMGTGAPTELPGGSSMSACVFATKTTAAYLMLTTMPHGEAQVAYARIASGDVFHGQAALNASYGKPVAETIAGSAATYFPETKSHGRAAGLIYARRKGVLLQIHLMGKGGDGHDLAAKLLAAALQKI